MKSSEFLVNQQNLFALFSSMQFKSNINLKLNQQLNQFIFLTDSHYQHNQNMALKSLLYDPNISAFLQKIPQNQHIVTLKQLIYIGIKIVSNSITTNPTAYNTLSDIGNIQNKKQSNKKDKENKKAPPQTLDKGKIDDKRINKSKSSHLHTLPNKNDGIQSALLREISKIRVQLQSLTNKVYDHYFEDQSQPNQNEESFEMNGQRQGKYVESYGFNRPQNIPNFSPSRAKQTQSYNTNPKNPFLRQKNSFFQTEGNKIAGKQTHKEKSFQAKQFSQRPEQGQRSRARSTLQHLDDTQVRQALYKQQSSQGEQQYVVKNRQKKSHSMIVKQHKQKKKDQQNFFYQLKADKQNLKELQNFKESKNFAEASYRDFAQDRPLTIDPFKKKAKSKIKPLVERDRLRYQNKVDQEVEKRNLEQYEYSANEQEQEEQDSSEQEEEYNPKESFQKGQMSYIEDRVAPNLSNKEKINSPQAQFERQRQVSNPNFGFYESKGKSSPSPGGKAFNRGQRVDGQIVNSRDDESSFSQFSQFSMSSSNSRRQVGKISRRRND